MRFLNSAVSSPSYELEFIAVPKPTKPEPLIIDTKTVELAESLQFVGTDGGPFVVIHERDGWRHAYLHARDGKQLAQITKGDFDIIERGINGGAPKAFEWYGAFALVVTLVWLYIEFLRLLAKLRSND